MTYTVQFPGLGFSVNVNTDAFTLGSFTVKWYGILIAAAFLLAFLYAYKSCKKLRINQDSFIDVVLVGVICGIIGARLYYVIFYPGDKYWNNPLEILNITEGGLGFYGGLIGGVVGGLIMAKIHKMPILPILDVIGPSFLLGQAIGRWGNFVNQEAFGTATDLPWRMLSSNTQEVVGGAAHPCFFYESMWCLIGFILLHVLTRKVRRYDGQIALCYMIWYGAGRFVIEGLRTDSLMTPVLHLRVSQVVALASVLAGIVLLIVFRKRTKLTGCGSQKVMELNNIFDIIEEEKIQEEEKIMEGPSTIFGDMDIDDDEGDALADEVPAKESEEAPAEEEETAEEDEDATEEGEPEEESDGE